MELGWRWKQTREGTCWGLPCLTIAASWCKELQLKRNVMWRGKAFRWREGKTRSVWVMTDLVVWGAARERGRGVIAEGSRLRGVSDKIRGAEKQNGQRHHRQWRKQVAHKHEKEERLAPLLSVLGSSWLLQISVALLPVALWRGHAMILSVESLFALTSSSYHSSLNYVQVSWAWSLASCVSDVQDGDIFLQDLAWRNLLIF